MARPLTQGCSEVYCPPNTRPALHSSKQAAQDPTLRVASMGSIVQEPPWLDPSPASSRTASSERGLPCPLLSLRPAALGEPVGQGPR